MNIASERAGPMLALACSLLLTLVIHEVYSRHLADMARYNGESRARAALHVLHPMLLASLDKPQRVDGESRAAPAIETSVAQSIQRIARAFDLRQVEIHDSHGRTRFVSSTNAVDDGREGEDVSDDPGFVGAMAGRPMGALAYRDEMSRFDKANVRSNVIEYYLPIRKHDDGPVIGVFETYIDADGLVGQMRHVTLLAGFAVMVAFAVFYWTLTRLGFAHGKALRGPRPSPDLEVSGRIPEALYDQTSEALRNINRTLDVIGRRYGDVGGMDAAMALGPLVHESVKIVRNLAISLPPPGLKERGLAWCCEVLAMMARAKNTPVSLVVRIDVPDEWVPFDLRVVAYRIVETTLDSLVEERVSGNLRVELTRAGPRLSLSMMGMRMPSAAGHLAVPGTLVARLEDWAIVSGGTLTVSRDGDGDAALDFEWYLQGGLLPGSTS